MPRRRDMQLAAGDHIRVRGRQWHVDDVTTFRDCAVVSLSGSGAGREPATCRLLLPFERPIKVQRRLRAKLVSGRAWMSTLLHTVSRACAFGQLRALDAAAITVHAFQLEPALALITGRASRILLADEVGLGKTIQAGLLLAELQARGWCERAIIVTPAGLRRQWIDELHRRFRISATLIDAGSLAALSCRLPFDVNPWNADPVVVTSIDFVKQPDVLRVLHRQLWDLLVVDEAHQATTGSLRYAAVHAIAARSRHVVLLTATPHDGNESDYRALCQLGQLDASDRIVLFRRTRQQTGLRRTRRVHLLRITPSERELDMHQLLSRYTARLWNIGRTQGRRDAQLVAMVLGKRAFSSARSLAMSLERRLALCSNTDSSAADPLLPFDVDLDALDAPPEMAAAGFEDAGEETAVLTEALSAARDAAEGETKMRVVLRLLRRIGEPLIVFTEYRDTLDALQETIGGFKSVVALHGGKSPDERRLAVDRFTRGGADVLLATDAGAEGLNLHERCRVLINLELPWNPMRLEQRIGRIDRIGQQKPVHVFNLIAEGTAERTVLATLLQRLDRIHASDIEMAASIIGRGDLPLRADPGVTSSHISRLELTAEASNEAARVESARKRLRLGPCSDESRMAVTFLDRSAARSPHQLPPNGFVWFVRFRIAAGTGRIVDETIVPIVTTAPDVIRRRHMRSLVAGAIADSAPAVLKFAAQLADARARSLKPHLAEWSMRALTRETSLHDHSNSGEGRPLQAGLFDSRAIRLLEIAERERNDIAEAAAAHAEHIEAASVPLIAQPPQLVLLLMVGRC